MSIHTHTSDQSDNSSFATGFALGLFMGAAGYYFFATEQGHRLRKQLAEEWEVAKTQLAKEGLLTNQNISLRDFIHDLYQKTLGHASDVEIKQRIALQRAESVVKKSTKPAGKTKKDTSKKFRGI